jgi:hypothetical protein
MGPGRDANGNLMISKMSSAERSHLFFECRHGIVPEKKKPRRGSNRDGALNQHAGLSRMPMSNHIIGCPAGKGNRNGYT